MMKHSDNPMQAAHQQGLSYGLLHSHCPGEKRVQIWKQRLNQHHKADSAIQNFKLKVCTTQDNGISVQLKNMKYNVALS